MAKNVTLLGANYQDVPAVQLPQTGGGTAMFVATDELFSTQEKTVSSNSSGFINLSDWFSGILPQNPKVICPICKTNGYWCSNAYRWSNGCWYVTLFTNPGNAVAESTQITLQLTVNKY